MTSVNAIGLGNVAFGESIKPAEKTEKKSPEQIKDGKKKIALALTALGVAAAAGIGIAAAVKKGKIDSSSAKNAADNAAKTAQKTVKNKAETIKETVDKYEALLKKDGISDKTKQQVEHRLEVLRQSQADIAETEKLRSMGNTKAQYLKNRKKEKLNKLISESLNRLEFDEKGNATNKSDILNSIDPLENAIDNIFEQLQAKYPTDKDFIEFINKNKDEIINSLSSLFSLH